MHTTTTGGNPLACAAALAQINVLLDEDLAGQAAEKGAYIMAKIKELQNRYPDLLKEVRGKGLLIGMEFHTNDIGYKVASGLFSRHVLTAGTLTNSKTIRIEPTLNIPYTLIDKTLQRLEDTFKNI
jgi:putrescine aminotransferase